MLMPSIFIAVFLTQYQLYVYEVILDVVALPVFLLTYEPLGL